MPQQVEATMKRLVEGTAAGKLELRILIREAVGRATPKEVEDAHK